MTVAFVYHESLWQRVLVQTPRERQEVDMIHEFAGDPGNYCLRVYGPFTGVLLLLRRRLHVYSLEVGRGSPRPET